jgi:ParB family chromosome partitioning protein
MAKKRPEVNLAQEIKPRTGDLEKLFSVESDAEQASGLHLLAVRLEVIQNDPEQPRRTFPENSLEELSESIRQEGVIQPIELTEIAPNQYQLVHGERRWKAAAMAGLETIPAVVRRIEYDDVTRLVRQLVENIQREDLNDIDRAAGLLRLRNLLQVDLESLVASGANRPGATPWSKTMTWAKVGRRLGMSRQRIHQLIRLLSLPEEIKEDVRDGRLSERETRVYQGLKTRQQRELHRARNKRNLTSKEVRDVVRLLKTEPGKSVYQAIREVRQPLPAKTEPSLESSFETETDSEIEGAVSPENGQSALPAQPAAEEQIGDSEKTFPTNIERLDWVRGHLARIQYEDLSRVEYQEIMRLLSLIQQDVTSLLAALLNERVADEHE